MVAGALPKVGAIAELQGIGQFLTDTASMEAALTKVNGPLTDLETSSKSAEAAARDLSSGLSQLGGVALGIGATMTALSGASALAAGKLDEAGIALGVAGDNAGYGQEQLATFETGLKKTGLSAVGTRQFMLKLIQSQVSLNEATKLARVAQDLAVVGMRDSTETANLLADTLATGNVRYLRQLGIVTTTTQALTAYGASQGLAGDELKRFVAEADTGTNRLALLNTIYSEGAKFAGVYEGAMESWTKQMRSLTGREIPDLAAGFGEVLQPAFLVGVKGARGVVGALNEFTPGAKAALAATTAVSGGLLTTAGAGAFLIPKLITLKDSFAGVAAGAGGLLPLLGSLAPLALVLAAAVGAVVSVLAIMSLHAEEVAKRQEILNETTEAANVVLADNLTVSEARVQVIIRGLEAEQDMLDVSEGLLAVRIDQIDALGPLNKNEEALIAALERQAGRTLTAAEAANELRTVRIRQIAAANELTAAELSAGLAIREEVKSRQAMGEAELEATLRTEQHATEVERLTASALTLGDSFDELGEEALRIAMATATNTQFLKEEADAFVSAGAAAMTLDEEMNMLTAGIAEQSAALFGIDTAWGGAFSDAIFSVASLNEKVNQMTSSLQDGGTVAVSSLQSMVQGARDTALEIALIGPAFPQDQAAQFLIQLLKIRAAIMQMDLPGVVQQQLLGALDAARAGVLQTFNITDAGIKKLEGVEATAIQSMMNVASAGVAGVDRVAKKLEQLETDRINAARRAALEIGFIEQDLGEFIIDNAAELSEELQEELRKRTEAAVARAEELRETNAALGLDILSAEEQYQRERLRIEGMTDEEAAANALAILDREHAERIERLEARAALEAEIQAENLEREIAEMRTAGAAGGEAMAESFLENFLPVFEESEEGIGNLEETLAMLDFNPLAEGGKIAEEELGGAVEGVIGNVDDLMTLLGDIDFGDIVTAAQDAKTEWGTTIEDTTEDIGDLQEALDELVSDPYKIVIEAEIPPDFETGSSTVLQRRIEELEASPFVVTITADVDPALESIIVAPGEPIVIPIIVEPIDDIPIFREGLEGLLGLGRGLGGFGGLLGRRFTEEQIEPIEDALESLSTMQEQLSDRYGELGDEADYWAEIMGRVPAQSGLGLRARREWQAIQEERLDVQEQLARLSDEEIQAQEELIRKQEELAALEKARADFAFVQEQLKLLSLITEYGLDPSDIFGGIELGVSANISDLMEAVTKAMQQIVQQANEELEAGSPSRKFMRLGEGIIDGLILGAQQALIPAVADMRQIMSEVTEAAALSAQGPIRGNLGVQPQPVVVVVEKDARQFNAQFLTSRQAPSTGSVMTDFLLMKLGG